MIDEKIAGDNQHHVIPQSGSEVTAADLLQIPVVSWLKQKQVTGQPFALNAIKGALKVSGTIIH